MDKLNADLDGRFEQMMDEIRRLRQQLADQQAQISGLAANPSAAVALKGAGKTTSRRRMLRRLAAGLVAGTGVAAITLGRANEAQARMLVDPLDSASQRLVGAVVVPPGVAAPGGALPPTRTDVRNDNSVIGTYNLKYGLIATDGGDTPLANVQTFASGVIGYADSEPKSCGVVGLAPSVAGTGLYGVATAPATNNDYPYNWGVYGVASGAKYSYGVYGIATGSIYGYGVYGRGNGISVWGDAGSSTPTTAQLIGVYGSVLYGGNYSTGVEGNNNGAGGTIVYGTSGGAYGSNGSVNHGVDGYASGTNSTNVGLYGSVIGLSGTDNYAVYGTTSGSGGSANYAGYFVGALVATSKSFRIDHPLDPANQYLDHACVESDVQLNLYSGVVALDAQGQAQIELPAWFAALNHDFRYQLTALSTPAPNLHIAQEITSNRFSIGGGQPGQRVSWQIGGVRQDAFAKANPLAVEVAKPDHERGMYTFPELYGQPATKGIGYVERQGRQPAPSGSPPNNGSR